MPTFADKLREFREGAGFTQRGLAKMAGIGLATVTDLEQGRNGPTWDTVQALCKALDLDVAAFVGTTSDPPKTKTGRGRPKKA